jgi:hypothetical protein
MVEKDPRAAGIKPEQFIDGRIFQELEREEFEGDQVGESRGLT